MASEVENRGYKKLLFEQRGPVLKVMLNIPEKRNALDMEVRPELIEVFEGLADDESVRVVILAGHGEHFCSGGDISSMKGIAGPVAARKRLKAGQRLVRAMTGLEKLIIAQVDGAAAGAGASLALASDLTLVSDRAKFFISFVKIGLAPDWGLFHFLPQRIGMARAKELILSARPVTAKEALEIGMVNRLVPAAELDQAGWDWARSMAEGPAQAQALIKAALGRWPMDFDSYLELEACLQAVALGGEDFKEGRDAFLEKRKPDFTAKG